MHGPSKDASLDQEGATAICWGGYLPSSADVGATATYRRAYRYPHEYLCPTSTVLYRFGGGVELPATQRPASRAFMGPWTGWLAGLAGRLSAQVCIILGLARRRPARADGPVSPASLTRCPALLGASGPVVSHRHLSLLTILPSSPEQFSSRLRHTSTRSWSSADIISARRSAPGRGAGDGMKTCRPSHGKRSYFPYPLHPPPCPTPIPLGDRLAKSLCRCSQPPILCLFSGRRASPPHVASSERGVTACALRRLAFEYSRTISIAATVAESWSVFPAPFLSPCSTHLLERSPAPQGGGGV